MSFEEIKSIELPTSTGTLTGVAASLQKSGIAKAKLRISLTSDVMSKMNFLPSNPLKVLMGTGEHSGIVRLMAAQDGPARFVERKFIKSNVRYIVMLGHCPQVADVKADATPCLWEKVDGDTLEITLPSWSRKVITRHVNNEAESELQRQNRESLERRQRMGMKP